MINFIPIKSGSSGNCYIVENDGNTIIVEFGISWKQIRHALNFKTSEVNFALVSHSHSDHSYGVKDALKAGVFCGMSSATAKELDVYDHHRVIYLESMQPQNIGPWRVLPFALEHDVSCLGYFISTGAERLLFVPDTGYVRARFQGVNILAIECNHIGDILSHNILEGNLPPVVGRRVRRNHMSLETLIEMLKANDLSQCRQIWLLHLSDGNSDEARMIKEVQEATGVPVYAA